jgi:hypothetical protein
MGQCRYGRMRAIWTPDRRVNWEFCGLDDCTQDGIGIVLATGFSAVSQQAGVSAETTRIDGPQR